MNAKGTFDVKLQPLPLAHPHEGTLLGRLSIDKQFHGDLSGTSVGEMLSVRIDSKGSGGYVAIEHVTATLHGKRGSFVFQHNGTANRGALGLSLTVVPDSGTGELEGLSGSMTITIVDGKHSYELEYTLPDAR